MLVILRLKVAFVDLHLYKTYMFFPQYLIGFAGVGLAIGLPDEELFYATGSNAG